MTTPRLTEKHLHALNVAIGNSVGLSGQGAVITNHRAEIRACLKQILPAVQSQVSGTHRLELVDEDFVRVPRKELEVLRDSMGRAYPLSTIMRWLAVEPPRTPPPEGWHRCAWCGKQIDTAELCVECGKKNDPFISRYPGEAAPRTPPEPQ